MAKVRIDQIDTVASEFEGAGTDSRQVSIKPGGVTEAKLGFSWETVEILASAFSYDGTRSTYTLATAASSNANVLDNAELLRNGLGGMDRVTTTSSTGEWSISGTTLSAHGDITASGDSYTVRYVVGTSSGASASGNLIWLGTVPQEPLHTKSDYFAGSSLDPKWTEWDVDNNTVVEVTGTGLEMTQATHAGDSRAGIVQAVPAAAQFVVTADLQQVAAVAGTASTIMLMVGDDLISSPSTAAFIGIELAWVTSGPDIDVNVASWTDYNSSTTNHASVDDSGMNLRYFRIFCDDDANNFAFLVSIDGRAWTKIATVTQAASTVTGDAVVLGLSVNNVNTGEDVKLLSRMVRVDETSDPYLPVGGYVGTSVASTFLTPRDVAVAPNSTLDLYGWTDRRAKLIKCEAFCTTVATVGAYTLAVTKDPNGTADNMLSAATFDLTTSGTLAAYVPTNVPLTSTADDLILDAGGVWEVSFVSDNAGLDAAGVYFQLTWLVL
jgi:hypothetical protein